MGQARERGLENLEVITADINEFNTENTYDRVVSVEMFEHVRNHRELFKRIHGWLNPGGKLLLMYFATVQHPILLKWKEKMIGCPSTFLAAEPCLRMSCFCVFPDNLN